MFLKILTPLALFSLISASVFAQQSNITAFGNETRLDSSGWTILANRRASNTFRMIDGRDSSRWNTRQIQRPGQWIEIDLGSKQNFSRIVLDTTASQFDFPRGYKVKVSNTGQYWRTVATGAGTNPTTSISIGQESARFIRITQTGEDNQHWWSIHEMAVFN